MPTITHKELDTINPDLVKDLETIMIEEDHHYIQSVLGQVAQIDNRIRMYQNRRKKQKRALTGRRRK
jgi:hypothetical protein